MEEKTCLRISQKVKNWALWQSAVTVFPESLSVNRRKALVDAYKAKYEAEDIYECPVCIVESEIHMVQALEDIKKEGCNALVVYLGNFGPEILKHTCKTL